MVVSLPLGKRVEITVCEARTCGALVALACNCLYWLPEGEHAGAIMSFVCLFDVTD